MKKLLENWPENWVALGVQDLRETAAELVQRDEDGVPVAWRLFGFGPVEVTKDGQDFRGVFTQEMGEMMMSHYRKKGAKLPVDSEHFLYLVSKKLGVPEIDLVNLLSRRNAAMGFGELALHDDGIWLENVEWVPLAREVLAEGLIRYFSPAVRGLQDGRLRITSVAMTNTPAINRMFDLVARGESEDVSGAGAGRTPAKQGENARAKGAGMNKLLTLVGALIGLDEIALSDDGEAPSDVIEGLENLDKELAGLRAAATERTEFMAGVKDALALADDAGLSVVQGKVLALAKAAEDSAALSERLQTIEKQVAAEKRHKLVDQGVAAGKLTPVMVEKLVPTLDDVALSAFLEAAPVIAAPGRTVDKGELRQPDEITLTADEKKVADQLGISHEDFLAQKKEDAKAAA